MCFLEKKLESLSSSSHIEILHMIWQHPLSAAAYLCFKETDSEQDSIKVFLSVTARSSPKNSAQKPFYDPDIRNMMSNRPWALGQSSSCL